MITSELILKTRPALGIPRGIMTIKASIPLYVWVEVLTHRLAARNASSSRAEKNARHAAHGWYTPPTFYTQGDFMQAGEPLSDHEQEIVRVLWDDHHKMVWENVENIKTILKGYNITLANEQINRLYTTTKMINGLITMSEAGWKRFLNLRFHCTADTAMQIFADQVRDHLLLSEWASSTYHVPFADMPPHDDHQYVNQAWTSAAYCARISKGEPGPGRRSSGDLTQKLIEDVHGSPFDHQCMWTLDPLGPHSTLPEDCWLENNQREGWEPYRRYVLPY